MLSFLSCNLSNYLWTGCWNETSMSNQAHQQIVLALRELAKLIKSVQYYPPGHPAVKDVILATHDAFATLLVEGEPLTCKVHRDSFILDQKPIGKDNHALQKLAPYFFARRIQNLLVMPDLSQTDLLGFAQATAQDVKEILRQGGIKEVLLKARITTIWVNETDLRKVLAARQQLEAEIVQGQGEEELEQLQLQSPKETRDLKTVLAELKSVRDEQRYRELMQELAVLLPQAMHAEGRLPLVEALALLCRFTGNRKIPLQRRELASHTLTQVTSREMVDYLIDLLCQRQLSERLREVLQNIMVVLKTRAISRLMEKLTGESDSTKRKLLVAALVHQGGEALPVLAEYLLDERWFVVRNAVAIIGDMRDPEGAQYLGSLLRHEDIRVCREVIRALAKTGGQDSVNLLLQAVEEKDEELSRQAMLSLGALKDPSALPALMRIVRQSDPFLKQAGLQKDAIRTLGEIGHSDCLTLLIHILGRRKWIRSRQYAEIRATAAQALGEIGRDEAMEPLAKATHDRHPGVARQANLALKMLQRTMAHAE